MSVDACSVLEQFSYCGVPLYHLHSVIFQFEIKHNLDDQANKPIYKQNKINNKKSVANEVKEFPKESKELPEVARATMPIVGVNFNGRQTHLAKLYFAQREHGYLEPAIIVYEEDNKYDSNAVMICYDNSVDRNGSKLLHTGGFIVHTKHRGLKPGLESLGYVPKELNCHFKELYENGSLTDLRILVNSYFKNSREQYAAKVTFEVLQNRPAKEERIKAKLLSPEDAGF